MEVVVEFEGQTFSVEVEPELPLAIFKSQLFSLTNLDPEQQDIEGVDSSLYQQDEVELSALGFQPASRIILKRKPSTPATTPQTPSIPSSASSTTSHTGTPSVPDLADVNGKEEDNPFVAEEDVRDWRSVCTSIFSPDVRIPQPSYFIVSQPSRLVCHGCSTTCFFPDQLKINSPYGGIPSSFICSCSSCSSCPPPPDFPHLPTLSRECLFEKRVVSKGEMLKEGSRLHRWLVNDTRTAAQNICQELQLQALSPSLLQNQANTPQAQILQRVQGLLSTVKKYEDVSLQQKALSTIPVEGLKHRAKQALEKAIKSDPSSSASSLPPLLDLDSNPRFREFLFLELLRWFKRDFFKWMNSPNCYLCSSPTTGVGSAQPTPEDLRFGADRVEVYVCKFCGSRAYFPRYNDPGKLLETRKGRCGEWANCFVLCCRAMGYETRYVLDFTDHVWVEVFSVEKQRWIHADCCESAYDSPLMYESGWGKKLSYIFAASIEELLDVTKRYTRKWEEVLTRRRQVPEAWLQAAVAGLNNRLQSTLPEARRLLLQENRTVEVLEMEDNQRSSRTLNEGELQERTSGSEEWRVSRGEATSTSSSSSSSVATTIRNFSDLMKEAKQYAETMGMNEKEHLRIEFNDFTDLTASSSSSSQKIGMRVVGTAKVIKERNEVRLRLTESKPSQVGAAWSTSAFSASDPFVAAFLFQITSPGADGFAFVVQGDSSRAIGGGGSDLGYAGIARSIAIEFDTFPSGESFDDPDDNHISIHSRGEYANSAHHSFSLACVRSPVNLKSGAVHSVVVSYGGEPDHRLLVVLNGKPLLQTTFDLTKNLISNQVFVGFTGATGGLHQNHDILSFFFFTTGKTFSTPSCI